MTASDRDTTRGRRLLLGRQLLDHQIVDRNGVLAGKVDDIELTLPDPDDTGEGVDIGGAGPPRPVVTALLSGNGALATRIGGRIGRLAAALSRRLLPDHGDGGADTPDHDGRIWFGDVTRLGNQVDIAAEASDLATHAVEGALRRSFVDRVPGAREPGA